MSERPRVKIMLQSLKVTLLKLKPHNSDWDSNPLSFFFFFFLFRCIDGAVIVIFYFFNRSLLEYNCFTILC